MGDESLRVSRRALVAWGAASAALATACARAPRGKIAPYVTQPTAVHPGKATFYATSNEVDGYGLGLLAECHEGRPTKIEGNPLSSASGGASGARDQALVASLYDPHRARGGRDGGGALSFAAFAAALTRPTERLGILLEPTSSRTVSALVSRIRRELPNASVWFDAPFARRNAWRATVAACGAAAEPIIDAPSTKMVLAIDADMLAQGPSALRDARGLVARPERALLVAIEGYPTATGAFADRRRAAGTRGRALLLRAIAGHVLGSSSAVPTNLRALAARYRAESVSDPFAERIARDLVALRGVVVAGDGEVAAVHALAAVLNAALGAPVKLVASSVVDAGRASFDTNTLAARVRERSIDTLVVIGGNPVYDARIFDAAALAEIKHTAYVGLYENETAAVAKTFYPLAHPLESWGEAASDDGEICIRQPMIEPLFGGRTVAEVLAAIAGDATSDARALTRRTFETMPTGTWDDALARGVVRANATALAVDLECAALHELLDAWSVPAEHAIEVALHASPSLHDGRFANVPVLQELPDPVTKLTWGNHALVAQALATELSASSGDEVVVRGKRGAVALPLVIDALAARGVVAIAHGGGRNGGERNAHGVGQNAFVLDDGEPVTIEKTGRARLLERTQLDFSLADRAASIARLRLADEAPLPPAPARLSLYDDAPRLVGLHQWGMTIDLDACTGCNACVAACQVENNVPTVGAAGVIAGRVMHWIRIDRYATRDQTVMQPMLCQHCEEAPCEYVCPVNATVHSADGLNEMVYNRCVGTRFCSNNCPYKVRRFNWFEYHEDETPLEILAHNPEVTVRERGVMEKCTFCVQRIRNAEQAASIEGRSLERDAVVTACAQACATRAIVFGDLADEGSALAARRRHAELYAALDELGTRPRVRYTPKVVRDDGAAQ